MRTDCEHVSDDDEDVQLIKGERFSRKSESENSSLIDQCINASEHNGNLMALYTFSLAMVNKKLPQ